MSEFDYYMDKAKEIIKLKQDMIDAVDRGEEIADAEFQQRFLILCDQFMECIRLAGPTKA